MTDVSYTTKATVRRAAFDAVVGKGDAANLKVVSATRSLASPAQNSTHKFLRFDSNTRLHALSRIYWGDFASSGSPTISVGLASVNNNFGAAVPGALTSGLDAATATPAGASLLSTTPANSGKMLWELAGLSSDPGGQIDIYVSILAAAGNLTADITIDAVVSID